MIPYTHSLDDRLKHRNLTDILNVPEVVVVNKFDEESVHKFKDAMTKAIATKQSVVPILIDSYGGQVYSLLAMLDMVKSCPVPVATVIVGKAMSCGSILFSAGKEGMRFMGENATIMIHDCNITTSGKIEEIKVDANEGARLNDKLFKFMALNCGKPENYFLDIVHAKGHADWFLTADDAKYHNLANHIRVPSFKIEVKVDISFS